MPLLFIIPLLAGLIAGYIFKTSTDEIGQLTGVVAAISLILSLVLAPWQLQVLILIVVLASTQKLLVQNEYQSKLKKNYQKQDFGSNNSKILGHKSESKDVMLEARERKIIGKYRGIPFKITQLPKMH
jgi:predicted membrane protein